MGAFLAVTLPLGATTLILNTTADAGIRSASVTTNYGSAPNAYMGNMGTTVTAPARFLMAFDLSSIPDGATITSVTLQVSTRIAMTGTTIFAADLYELSSSFSESSVTWSNSSTGTAWSTAGGDYNSTLLGVTNVNPQSAMGTINSWSSSALISLVQTKSDSNSMVYLMIKADNETLAALTNSYASFQTKEGPSTGGGYASVAVPELVIEYSMVPEPSSAALLLGGFCLLTLWTGRRGHREAVNS